MIDPEWWKKTVDEACKVGWKWHLDKMANDPVYKAEQEALDLEYERIFNPNNEDN